MSTAELPDAARTESDASRIMLANGEWLDIAALSPEQLEQLQWEQERAFAAAMQALPKGSRERALITGQAYNTVCQILATLRSDGTPLLMGLDQRYLGLVLSILNTQVKRGVERPQFFEIGYGSGSLLKEVSQHGFSVGGVEISATIREQALQVLGSQYEQQLLLGDLRETPIPEFNATPSLIYWNDVFEHICPDEIGDYLQHIYQMLLPGGALVTITPNWLLRPSDVTAVFCPPRTESQGLHLKEYRLAEVTSLLKAAGFRQIATPLLVSRQKIHLAGSGLRQAKQIVEPWLESLPVKFAHLACRGLGLSYTIATK